jgi:hypothetical protein
MNKTMSVFLFLTIAFILYKCKSEQDEGGTISHSRTIPGGCNTEQLKSAGTATTGSDSLKIFIKNDTLHVFVGLNYTCCSPFETKTEIFSDSVVMQINDKCQNLSSCYCKCMCYYTFDFQYTNWSGKKFYYKILLNDPRQSNTKKLFEGWIDNGRKLPRL